MNIDYKLCFEKLCEQIDKEYEWAKADYDNQKSDLAKERFNRGMMFAYGSIKELADKMRDSQPEKDYDLEVIKEIRGL